MGDRYVKSDESKKRKYNDANKFLGWAMSQSLPYDEIKLDKNVKLDDMLNIFKDSDNGFFRSWFKISW